MCVYTHTSCAFQFHSISIAPTYICTVTGQLNIMLRTYILGKSPPYTLELSQKSDFQHLATKPDNKDHSTVEISQF